ncbi:MAG: TIGR03619 family F420-dependent LLM class oxidoreductase [Chloroflexi bacterium]|nr:TIGR03619 family F420-dependent LLM class oxidoreductase [Chloroflexota bacterium]MDA1272341.1 TIGR03619 family F420-dependent LLM class oxidoreductase [Chloroflexota bacterium]
MKVGVNLINFGPGVTPESIKTWARLTESLGYHLIMTCDHVAITPDVQSRYPAPFFEPISLLGWLAGVTNSIEIGTTVLIVPYRNPLEIAKATANIDQLSGGRFILGVGIGWAQDEFKALQVPFRSRGAITNEYLEAIKLFWTHDVASYEGKFASFTNVHTAPRPVRSPHPPIWVGGPSDAAMRRTVRYGDAWHPIRIRLGWFKDTGIPRLQEIADEEGQAMPMLCPRIRLRLTDSTNPDPERVAGEGSLEQVRRDLAELEELGCSYVVLDTYYDDIEATRNNDASWRMLTTLAEKALDLPNQTVR